jgi:hypothetical protein
VVPSGLFSKWVFSSRRSTVNMDYLILPYSLDRFDLRLRDIVKARHVYLPTAQGSNPKPCPIETIFRLFDPVPHFYKVSNLCQIPIYVSPVLPFPLREQTMLTCQNCRYDNSSFCMLCPGLCSHGWRQKNDIISTISFCSH